MPTCNTTRRLVRRLQDRAVSLRPPMPCTKSVPAKPAPWCVGLRTKWMACIDVQKQRGSKRGRGQQNKSAGVAVMLLSAARQALELTSGRDNCDASRSEAAEMELRLLQEQLAKVHAVAALCAAFLPMPCCGLPI